jgi:hypothetical protein
LVWWGVGWNEMNMGWTAPMKKLIGFVAFSLMINKLTQSTLDE